MLTFDDASKSHYTVARPLLKKYKFGATFFVTEGFDFPTNKKDYMTWEEIAKLHDDGFEIGNHTRDHKGVTADSVRDLAAQLTGHQREMQGARHSGADEFRLPRQRHRERSDCRVLKELGITFARRGGSPEFPYKEGRGFAYEPGLDHPLLIPSAGDARPDLDARRLQARRRRRRSTARSPCCSSTACPTRRTIG